MGPTGAAGPTGATGVVGNTTIVVGGPQNTGGNAAVGTTTGLSTATCAAGSKLLGGGADIIQGSGDKGAVAVSRPTPQTNGATPTGWEAQGIVVLSGSGNVTVRAYAICSVP